MGYIVLDGQKLQQLRAPTQKTQKEIALKAGVAYATYNKAENGHRVQTLPAGRIAKFWKRSIRSLQLIQDRQSA